MKINDSVVAYYWRLRINVYARSIARQIITQLKHDVSHKYGPRIPIGEDSERYLESRAVHLTQPLVDKVMCDNPQIPNVLGNKLLLIAARRAVTLIWSESNVRKKSA